MLTRPRWWRTLGVPVIEAVHRDRSSLICHRRPSSPPGLQSPPRKPNPIKIGARSREAGACRETAGLGLEEPGSRRPPTSYVAVSCVFAVRARYHRHRTNWLIMPSPALKPVEPGLVGTEQLYFCDRRHPCPHAPYETALMPPTDLHLLIVLQGAVERQPELLRAGTKWAVTRRPAPAQRLPPTAAAGRPRRRPDPQVCAGIEEKPACHADLVLGSPRQA